MARAGHVPKAAVEGDFSTGLDARIDYHRGMSAACPLDPSHPALAPLAAAGFTPERTGQILRFYDEPHRLYHDRSHLREMLDMAVACAVPLSAAQALAILLHDAIYVPGAPRGTNELMSAHLLRVYANGLAPALVALAAGIVLDTADHVARRPEAEHVLDLDLLRLAVASPHFERFSRQVFDEQRGLMAESDDGTAWHQFEQRRAPFFEKLLARPAIYVTAHIHRRCETSARANLARALGRPFDSQPA